MPPAPCIRSSRTASPARSRTRFDAKRLHRPAAAGASRARCERGIAAASFARAGTDVLVIWNRTGEGAVRVDAIGARRCIHWEHGAAWDAGRDAERRDYLARVPLAIANSTAAARVLQLLWGYRGDVRVCRNALRPSLLPAAPMAQAFPRGAHQARRGGAPVSRQRARDRAACRRACCAGSALDVELHVAGAGPELPRLRSLGRRAWVLRTA